MQKKHPLYDLLAPVIEQTGFDVVRIMTIGTVRPTLQIMIEPKSRENLTVDDCATVSRAVSAVLDEKDPIEGEYSLEVSSPGLDRPLTTLEHFVRFAGYEAKIETDETVEGRKRFKGMIIAADDDGNIDFEMEGKEYRIPFTAVAKAKLVLTDALLNEAAAAVDNK